MAKLTIHNSSLNVRDYDSPIFPQFFVVRHAFFARHAKQVSVASGDIVCAYKKSVDGWTKVRIASTNGEQLDSGWMPGSYLILLSRARAMPGRCSDWEPLEDVVSPLLRARQDFSSLLPDGLVLDKGDVLQLCRVREEREMVYASVLGLQSVHGRCVDNGWVPKWVLEPYALCDNRAAAQDEDMLIDSESNMVKASTKRKRESVSPPPPVFRAGKEVVSGGRDKLEIVGRYSKARKFH